MPGEEWEQLGSERVFEDPHFKVRRDTVRLPSGRVVDDYLVGELEDYALVVAVTPDGATVVVTNLLPQGPGTDSSLAAEVCLVDATVLEQTAKIKLPPGSTVVNHVCVSPDGKYILYYSNEPGNPEVFVRTYPDLKGKWQVSRNGGQLAIWTPDGREILYINAVGRMMSVPVQRAPTFIPGVPRELFDITQMYTPNIPLANWDITPDGKRFIFIRSTNFNATVSMFNIVFNWRDELTRELSGKK